MDSKRYAELVMQCNKLINKYIFQAKKFVDYACFQYGMVNYNAFGEKDSRFADDFAYFVFTKSTKSLISIRLLLKESKNEDALIILRSIFEGYLSCRFFSENSDLIDDFVFTPVLIANKICYYNSKEQKLLSRDGSQLVYSQKQPSELKLGKDKSYFYDFYDYLCNYAHCNYSILPCYLNSNQLFSVEEITNSLLIRVLVLFTFSKLFEQVVTVEGEEFLDDRTEKACYQLVKEATTFLDKMLGHFSKYDSDTNEHLNKHMKAMFKDMKKSLKEEVGSVKKDFLS